MKKFVTILTMVLIFSVCSMTVTAARSMNGRNYVDADNDSICDYYGRGYGCGRGYVDADGDGICDNMKYSIKYNLKGGKNNKKNPSYYYSTSKTIKLKNPTKKGYKFKGWYADKKYKNKVTSIKKGSFGKKTLYAKWKKK